MQALVTVIAVWLAAELGLPAMAEAPRIAFSSNTEMMELRTSGGATTSHSTTVAIGSRGASQDGVYAVYDDRSRTIHLAADWNAASPVDVSVLVHELVHHLQNSEGLKFACPGERERPAYEAQSRWLKQFGTTLAEAFQIDPMTLLVRTSCMR